MTTRTDFPASTDVSCRNDLRALIDDRTELNHFTTSDLRQALHECQVRLGTEEERADDLDRARSLAHAINNRQQAEYLKAVLDAMTQGAPDPDLLLVA
jgi:hypothetical protein